MLKTMSVLGQRRERLDTGERSGACVGGERRGLASYAAMRRIAPLLRGYEATESTLHSLPLHLPMARSLRRSLDELAGARMPGAARGWGDAVCWGSVGSQQLTAHSWQLGSAGRAVLYSIVVSVSVSHPGAPELSAHQLTSPAWRGTGHVGWGLGGRIGSAPRLVQPPRQKWNRKHISISGRKWHYLKPSAEGRSARGASLNNIFAADPKARGARALQLAAARQRCHGVGARCGRAEAAGGG
jgi:hypothetical protein